MTEAQALLKVSDLRRHYHMGENLVKALDGADLGIEAGEFVMIVGSSGSGKSTLMHLLGGLDQPSSGRYTFGGEDVACLDDEALSRLRNRRIGFVFQQFNLLNDLTVVENIAMPLVYAGIDRKTRLARARHFAALVGLGDRLDHRPSELSGGQSQRVAIARALVNEPQVIFADEPTGNLDSRTGLDIMELLFALNDQGYTIIMVTHDRDLARRGSRRITLRDGLIVSDEGGERKRSMAVPDVTYGGVGERRISFFDLVRIGVREGLLAHKMRTTLTMLGIIIAVAGVIAMSSFSLGSKRKQANQIRALGANLIRVVDQQLEGQKLTDARMGGSGGLSLDDLHRITEGVPFVQRSSAVRQIKLNTPGELSDANATVLGVAGDYLGVNNLTVAAGRFLQPNDGVRCARVAVIGRGISDRLGEGDVLGRRILMGGTPYTIVGVLADRGVDIKGLEATGARDANLDILVPLQTVLRRTRQLEMRSELDEIHMQIESADVLYEAGTATRRILMAAHGGKSDFSLVVPLDLLKQKQQASRLLDILTIAISSVALIVGGIGIMNIMLASVTERTREIGVRRAVGASERGILHQFLSESILISITGGVLGLVLALAAVAITSTAIHLPVVFSIPMIGVALVASTLTGLAFGLYPAMQAARKNPVEALRYE